MELTKLYLERLRRFDPLLKCVVTFMDELGLKQAERADQELRAKNDRGPLHGIPWGIKDIFSYPGYPTTWGVWQYRDRVIDVKAAVAERLENAGAVLVAKLATNTLAGGSVLWYRGITRNPWNPRGMRGVRHLGRQPQPPLDSSAFPLAPKPRQASSALPYSAVSWD